MSDRDIFKCHCNYQHGMGPNLQCPLHGTRENLHHGVLRQRREITRLEKLLRDVAEVSNSRVIKTMIKLGLNDDAEPLPKDCPWWNDPNRPWWNLFMSLDGNDHKM